jgi:hypothetical protein
MNFDVQCDAKPKIEIEKLHRLALLHDSMGQIFVVVESSVVLLACAKVLGLRPATEQ